MRESINLKLQAVTPIFSYGATDTPEIRPGAIKGQLRFWFRAMMGGVLGGDWERVKELEARVFGSTEQRSSFDIRVKVDKTIIIKNKNDIPEIKNRDGTDNYGFLYLSLGFQTFKKDRTDRRTWRLQKSVFWPSNDENGDFEVNFVFRDSNIKNVILGSMWMLENFGGIGQRIRRGFGGIRVINPPDGFLWKWDKTSLYGLEASLSAIAVEYANYAICHISDPIPEKDIFSIHEDWNTPSFSCFAKWRLMYGKNNLKTWNSWIDAMDFMGRELQEFRINPHKSNRERKETFDYSRGVSDFFNGDTSDSIKYDFINDAFGLPIQYQSRSRSIGGKQYKASLEAENNIDRRASPLLIRPVFISNKEYGLILLFFNAKFLPEGFKEILKPKGSGWNKPDPIPVTPADLSVINNLINEVEKEIKGTSIGNYGGKLE